MAAAFGLIGDAGSTSVHSALKMARSLAHLDVTVVEWQFIVLALFSGFGMRHYRDPSCS